LVRRRRLGRKKATQRIGSQIGQRPVRDHGHDFNEMRNAADRLDHYAHLLRRLHDNELGQNWRHESLADRG
jgi:hypothetical protein